MSADPSGDPGQLDDLVKTERHSTRGRRSAFGKAGKAATARSGPIWGEPPAPQEKEKSQAVRLDALFLEEKRESALAIFRGQDQIRFSPVRAEAPAEAGGAARVFEEAGSCTAWKATIRAQEPYQLSGLGRCPTRSVPLLLVLLSMRAVGAAVGLVGRRKKNRTARAMPKNPMRL